MGLAEIYKNLSHEFASKFGKVHKHGRLALRIGYDCWSIELCLYDDPTSNGGEGYVYTTVSEGLSKIPKAMRGFYHDLMSSRSIDFILHHHLNPDCILVMRHKDHTLGCILVSNRSIISTWTHSGRSRNQELVFHGRFIDHHANGIKAEKDPHWHE